LLLIYRTTLVAIIDLYLRPRAVPTVKTILEVGSARYHAKKLLRHFAYLSPKFFRSEKSDIRPRFSAPVVFASLGPSLEMKLNIWRLKQTR